MIEKRLKDLEIAVTRLNATMDRLIEAQYAAIRRVTVPADVTKPIKPKRVTRERLIELAQRYENVKGIEDLDILLRVYDIERLVDLPKHEYEKFYNQMLRELHTEFENPGG